MGAFFGNLVDRASAALRPRDNAFQRREITETIRSSEACSLCALTERSVARYLDILAYEHVNDIPMRDHLRASRGFCNQHAWQMLEQIRDPMGIGIIYRDVVNDVVKTLDRYLRERRWPLSGGSAEADRAKALAGRLRPRRSCVACDQARTVDEDNLHAVSRYLREPEFARSYSDSVGACAWHARRLLTRVDDEAAAAAVIDTHARWIGRLPPGSEPGDSAGVLADAIGGRSGARPCVAAVWAPGVTARSAGRYEASPRPSLQGMEEAATAIRPDGNTPGSPLWLTRLDCPVCASARDARVAPPGAGGTTSGAIDAACARHTRARLEFDLGRGSAAPTAEEDAPRGTGLGTGPLCGLSARGGGQPARLWTRQGWREAVCPDCLREAEASMALVADLFAVGAHESLARACLPHLYQACLVPASPAARAAILSARAASWRALVEALLEYIRKLDYRFRSEPRGDEQRSPRLAVPQMVGHNRLG